MEGEIKNKIAESGLLTIDLSAYIPQLNDIHVFDIKPFLFKELILKEQEFREQLKAFDFSIYQQKMVCITNTVNAIIPPWAYMLIASYMTSVTPYIYIGNKEAALDHFTVQTIEQMDTSKWIDKRIVVKGCSDVAVSNIAFMSITKLLLPHAKSIMYGEPCSTVPIYKKK